MHQNFIDQVIKGRANRLRGDCQEIFLGDVWTGKEATNFGIVDGTANLWTVLEQAFSINNYKDYTTQLSFLQTLFHNTVTELYFHLTNETLSLRK